MSAKNDSPRAPPPVRDVQVKKLSPEATASDVTRLVVRVRDPLYRLCWAVVLGLHIYCGVHLILLAQVYWYLAHPYLTYFTDLLAPADNRHFKLYGTVFGIVGGVHLWCIAEMVLFSAFGRRLVMSYQELPDQTISNKRTRRYSSIIRSFAMPRNVHAKPTRIHAVLDTIQTAWLRVFARDGILGLDSAYFEVVFVSREFIEIACQSYQAYRTSQQIARPWLNRLFVALVIANCWTTPLTQRVLRNHPALIRLWGISIDVALNIGTNMVIPVIVFWPYLQAWDAAQYSFDLGLLYDDLWFSNMVTENRLLYALSLFDFASKIFPHASIFFCVGGIKTLVERQTGKHAVVYAARVVDTKHELPAENAAVPEKQLSSEEQKSDRPSRVPSDPAAHFQMNGWKTRIIQAIFWAWGIALLVIHTYASRVGGDEDINGCKQTIHPWFISNLGCTTYEYNCYRLQDQLDITHALEQIDPTTLVSLIISHCQDLVVPPTLRNFSNLLSLELYNVSLQQWGRDAAISPVIHTSLVALLLIHVNMTALPEGIVLELPAALTDIEIAYTNLTTLPDDLHEIWHPMAVLYFEFSQVREFPSTLKQLEIYDLSLIGNHMETVPALAELPFEYYFLALSHNPLRELPSEITGGGVFGFLALEHTAVAAIPAWAGNGDTVYAQGSPVCDDGLASSAAPLPANAVCEEADPRGGGRYPLSIMSPRRMV